jgi:hypothetical protein
MTGNEQAQLCGGINHVVIFISSETKYNDERNKNNRFASSPKHTCVSYITLLSMAHSRFYIIQNVKAILKRKQNYVTSTNVTSMLLAYILTSSIKPKIHNYIRRFKHTMRYLQCSDYNLL